MCTHLPVAALFKYCHFLYVTIRLEHRVKRIQRGRVLYAVDVHQQHVAPVCRPSSCCPVVVRLLLLLHGCLPTSCTMRLLPCSFARQVRVGEVPALNTHAGTQLYSNSGQQLL